uniref:Adrenomedullin n=1 Tax=Gadus morhua TaxID=8049 RepID=A0A8C5BP09_GADMO
MRSSLHAVICCCVFSSFLALERNTDTVAAGATLKRRLAVWLQGRVKRELCHSCARASEAAPPSHSEASLTDRSSRSSANKNSGCYLITCTVHDLIFRVHQFNDKTIDPTAPGDKIRPHGYGRRRRSLKDGPLLHICMLNYLKQCHCVIV